MSINTLRQQLLFGIPRTLESAGQWIGLLSLRLLLAYEFFEAGLEKLHGDNWFAQIQSDFPFPFSVVPPGISWQMATWTELLASVALILGLFTRFASAGLFVLTIVAWASVHAGHGYNVCDNGYKLPLIYLALLLPLMLSGPGRLSVDHWIARRAEVKS